MRGEFLIYTKRGRRFYRLIRGRIICTRNNAALAKSGRYYGDCSDGTHVMDLSEFGYDACDRIV